MLFVHEEILDKLELVKDDSFNNEYSEFTIYLLDMIFNPIPNFGQSIIHNHVEFPSIDDIIGGN